MRPVLTLFSALAIAVGAAPVAAAGQHESARVWITTPDGAMKMADAGQVDFTSTPANVPTVVVDASRTFQTMEGFGASITDSSAAVLYRLSPRARFDAMRDLFDTRTG